MKEIKRYTDKTYHDLKGMARTAFAEETDGEWVKYTDHKAVVETQSIKIQELSKQIINLIDFGECSELGYCLNEIYAMAQENIAKGIE